MNKVLIDFVNKLQKKPRQAALVGGLAGLSYVMYSAKSNLSADSPAAVPYAHPWSHKGPLDSYDAARFISLCLSPVESFTNVLSYLYVKNHCV